MLQKWLAVVMTPFQGPKKTCACLCMCARFFLFFFQLVLWCISMYVWWCCWIGYLAINRIAGKYARVVVVTHPSRVEGVLVTLTRLVNSAEYCIPKVVVSLWLCILSVHGARKVTQRHVFARTGQPSASYVAATPATLSRRVDTFKISKFQNFGGHFLSLFFTIQAVAPTTPPFLNNTRS